MDFRYTPEQEAFRKEIQDFLDWALPQVEDEERPFQYNRYSPKFTKLMAERNYLALSWPKEYGGAGLGFIEQMILNEEFAKAHAPIEYHRRAINYAGPVIIRHGTDEQKARFLEPIRRGEIDFCQLYSEPNAGSDLAGLQTRADRDGDRYIVNGQKIWTSGGHVHKYGILLARTDVSAPKHRGISMFFVPMNTPGITVRPLINMANRHGFNEVFLENVVVEKDMLIGHENQGWYQSRTLLEFERSSIAANSSLRRDLDALVSEFQAFWKESDPGYHDIRKAIAEVAIRIEVSKNLSLAVASRQAKREDSGGQASMVKLLTTELTQYTAHLGAKVARMHGQGRMRGDMTHRDWDIAVASSVAATIGGGTSEIQRNVMGLRYLDLPRG